MDFILTKSQEEYRKKAAEFAEAELSNASKWDKEEIYDEVVFKKLGEYGLLGVPYPKEFGGSDGDFLSHYLIIEEIAKKCASTALHVSGCVSLFVWPILTYGKVHQKEIIRNVSSGIETGTFMLTEENAGSDATNIRLIAEKRNDCFILNGKKVLTTNARRSRYFIVFASTDLNKGSKGITAFLISSDTEGIIIDEPKAKMGLKSTETCNVTFDNVIVNKNCILGEEGKGIKVAFSSLDGSRIGVAAQSLGIAEGAFEIAKDYVKKRKQFGEYISQFQGIQWMIAEMETKISASKLLTYKAAFLRDKGLNCTIDGSIAKLFASETANYITSKSVQLLGGNGYLNEYTVERMMRDAKITEIYEGTTEILKTIIGRSVLK